MVSMGIEEPLKETDYGMKNPYRSGLDQFLANAEAKEKLDQDPAEATAAQQKEWGVINV